MKKVSILFCASLLAIGGIEIANAQVDPDTLKFRRVRGANQELVLKDCSLIAGSNRAFVIKSRRVEVAPRGSRKLYTLPKGYKFFSCSGEGDGQSVLFARATKNGEATQFTFTEESFPEKEDGGDEGGGGAGIGSVCPNGTKGIGFGVLYKPAADASDAREGKPVVLLQGSNKTKSSSLNIYASNGEKICNFTFKSSSIPGVNGGSDHYFSGWTGGCGLTGGQIATKAKQASGNTNIYIQSTGGKCLGPVNPNARSGGIG